MPTKPLCLIFCLGVIVIVASCKKSSNENITYLTLQMANKAYSFDSLVAIQQPGPPAIILRGYSKTQGSLEILLSDALPGKYEDQLYNNPPTSDKTIFEFTINAVAGTYNNGYLLQQLLLPGIRIANCISVNVSEINANFIAGNFSGNMVGITGAAVPISNGRFRIHF